MSGKSNQRHVPRSKRKKAGPGPAPAATPAPAIAARNEPPAPPRAAGSVAARPLARPAAKPVSYHYVVTELKRIGILGGIMLALLVVLSLVLS